MTLKNYTTYIHASTPATVPPTWHPNRKRQEKKKQQQQQQKPVSFKGCNVRAEEKGGRVNCRMSLLYSTSPNIESCD